MTPQPAVLEDLDWPKDAINMLTAYAKSGLVFSAEDLRESMRPAPSPSQVGTAFREAHRLGIIRPTGYKESSTPSRKGGVIRQWRAATFKEKS